MNIRKVSFKNFKSYSNAMTEILFDKKSSLNLIVGENGTGKTSIAECITYLLYGKLDDFNAADIPNRVNKNFYGKIELDCQGHEVIIERGLNPSLFKVQIDGENIDTAGKANVQTMLEESYMKIPYSVFHNTLVLEMGDMKSLLSMSPADKRNIIDKICGFTIFNQCAKLVKEDIKSLEYKVSSFEGSFQTMKNNLAQYNRQIEEIKENSSTQEELDKLTEQIKKAEELKEKYDKMLNNLRKAKDEIKSKSIMDAGEYKNLKEKIDVINKKIALIDGGKCPTCGSSLETEDFQKERVDLLNTKSEYEHQMQTIKNGLMIIQSKINTLDKKEVELRQGNNSIGLMDLQSEFKYKTNIKEKGTEKLEELRNNLLVDIEKMNEEKKKLDDYRNLLNFFNTTFSDGGVKRYISNHYIPIINNLMSGMMDFMGFNFNVTFDNNFDSTIMQNGYNVKYATLSKGQKSRVDFAAIIAFVQFLKLQFGELNLLFLDELFAHVDTNGMSDMIDILKKLSSDLNLNIFLIHHAKLENILFDNVIHTTMTDGFSHIEYI